MEDHVGPPLPRPTGTLAARHKPFHRFALREHLPTRAMDELDTSMTTETNEGQRNPEVAASAAHSSDPPVLSPTRVERADLGQTTSADKPRKKTKAVHESDESASEEDAAMASQDHTVLHDLAATAGNEDARHLLLHSRAARDRASGLHQLMTDASYADTPVPMPPGQSVLGSAADALARAIDAPRLGAAAAGSSPPREHIRMAPKAQAERDPAGWNVWSRRGGNSVASTSTDASAPTSPKGGNAWGVETSNRFEAIGEEPRVRPDPSRGGGWRRCIVAVVMTAMTAIDTRGTYASHVWHDQPVLKLRQVTPFDSQELRGAWKEMRELEKNKGLEDSALAELAMHDLSFRERALATERDTLEQAVGEYLAARVEESRTNPNGAAKTRQSTIKEWLPRNASVAVPDPKRPTTAPIQGINAPYVIPRAKTSQARITHPALGPQGLRPQGSPAPRPPVGKGAEANQTQNSDTDPEVIPDQSPEGSPNTPRQQGEPVDDAEGEGPDIASEEYQNEVIKILVGNVTNATVMADDVVALQFGQHLYEQDVPNCDDAIAAVCVGRGGKGPWLISVPRFAAQAALNGNRQWTAYSTDGLAEILMTTWPVDKLGNKILPERENRSAARAQEREYQREKEDAAKVMIIINAPKRFVGSQLKKKQMVPIVTAIREVLTDVEDIGFGIVQGLTAELRMPRNSVNVFINPGTNREDPYEKLREVLPKLKYLPIHETSFPVEPGVGFMPSDIVKKVGVTSCCFRRQEVCDAGKRGGFCTFKETQLGEMGYNASLFRPQRPGGGGGGHSENTWSGERKRKREEQDTQAKAKVEAAKQARLQMVLGKLCKLFQEGKVRPPHTYIVCMSPAPKSEHRMYTVRTRKRVQQRTQHRTRTKAHKMHVRKDGGRGRGTMLPHDGHVPVHPTQRREGTRSDGGDGDGTLRICCTAIGDRSDCARRTAHQQREPERGDEGPGNRQRASDTRRLSAEACTPTCVRALRSDSRLADGFQTGGVRNRFRRGGGMRQPGLLAPLPHIRTRAASASVHRRHRERGAHTHAHADGHGRQRMASYVSPRGDTSDNARPQAHRMRQCGTANINTHHWHTNNILWLMGRLPWHRVTYNA